MRSALIAMRTRSSWSASGPVRGQSPGDAWHPDPVEINIRRLEAGEPMGDYWLWGRGALQLVAKGADRHELRQRRISAVQRMAEVYDEATVQAKLAELKAKHSAAENELHDTQRRHRDLPAYAPKRAFTRAQIEGMVE